MPWNKTDRSFKTLINKRVTDSDGKFYFNEKGDYTLNLHQLEVWTDAIPATAPGVTSDIVQVYNTLTLVEDTSVPNQQTWFATTNSSTVPAQTDENARLKDWISDKYGATYEIELYDTSNVQIPPSDGCSWFFDYQTGILTFGSTTTTTGGGGSLSSRAPFKIKGYRYVGRKGIDANVIKNEVRVATTPATSFSGWSYSSEVIDTGVTTTSLTIDGVTLNTTTGLTGDRVLIKDWSTLSYNGIYYVERVGDGASATWRFQRAPDFNDTEDVFAGAIVFVRSGTLNARTVWSMTNTSFTTLDGAGPGGEITFGKYTGAVTTPWSAIVAPIGNLSLAMSTYTTVFNWATGTSSNDLLSLTTDASANGTGALLKLKTGAGSSVLPLRVQVGSTDYLVVNASGHVLVSSLTSGRVTYAGTSGRLIDSANLTFDGSQLALPVTGSSGGLLIGADTNLYRSATDTLKTDDAFVVGNGLTVSANGASITGAMTGTSSLTLGQSGSSGLLILQGATSGAITVRTSSAAGTYNFNLPTTAGSSGDVLTSGGGSLSAMTWTNPGALAVRWSSLVAPTGNLSLSMSTNLTTFNWATGTSSNNLFSLTTDASANGTGALLFLATGASSTVVPLRVRVGSTDYLVVNASGNVLVSTLTSGRVTYATTSGQLTDSANMTFNGSQIALSVTGSSGGLLLGGDANLYRSGADVLATDDHFNLATTDREIRIATSSNTSGGINFNSGASRISASGTSLRITQTNATGSLAYIGIEGGRSLAPTGTGTNSGSIIGAHFSAAADDSSAGGAVNFSATQTVSGVHAEAYANVLAGASIVASLTGLYANVHFYDDTNLGRLNNLYGVYSYVNATAEAGEPLVDKAYAFYSDMDIPVTENNQERYGLYLKAMPAPGSFTGVVTAAIRMAGTGGARDGLLFASDTNLYRSAADTLKTDDAFVAAAGLTIGTMTSGSVLFSGASGLVSQNNSNLFWDNSNTTLGIGTTRTGSISGTNPSVRIKGTGASSATSAFEVQDSGGNTLLFVRNDGYIGIGLNNPSYHLHFVHTHASDASFTLQNNALTVTSAETGRDIRNLHNTLTIDAGANAISPAGSAFMPNFCNQLIVASGQSGAITVPLYGIHNEVNFIATAGTTHTLVNGVRTLFSMAAGAGSTVTTLDCFLSEVTSGSASSMTVTNLTHYNASYSLSGSPVIGTLTGLNIPNPGAGTVTTQYGIRIRDLSRASTNYAIYLDGTSGLSRQGIWWNADTNLYRSAADTLKTDDAFIAAGGLTVGTLTLGSVVFAGASGALSQDNSNFFWDDTNNFLGVGASASPAARLHLAGNISASTWSTAGIGLRYAGATYTDTASSGTVAAQVVHAFAQPTLAASSSTTYTAAATVYIADAPAAGSNATLTSAYALWVDSGTVRLDGNVLVGTLTSGRVTFAGTGGLLGDSVNMTFNGNRLALATTGNTGGLLIGGDTNLYRSAADVLATDDHVALTTTDRELRLTTTNENTGGIVWNTSYRLSTNAQSGFYFTVPDSADTGGGVYGVRMARRLAPTADSGTTLYGFDSSATVSDVSASGPLNFTDSGTGFSALSLYETFQTGGTLATQYGLRATASFYDDNGGTGGVLAAQVGAYILTDDSGGSGSVVTGSRVLLVEQASPYTANGQTRYGLYVVAMPDPGSFTGTTTAAIRLAGTGGARDGVLFGSDTNIYRSASNTLKTDDALVVAAGLTVLALGASVTGAISGTTSLTLGANGGTGGTVVLNGATSGAVTMTVQASAGTYNFNLPTTAGSSGYLLTSAGGVASPMTWTDPGALAVRWNSLTNPSGNLSLTMSTNLTTFNWATGTSSNNLFSLTTDASANGTGALLNIQTGASAAVLPLRVRAGSVEAIYVNASGQVSIGTSTASATLTVRKSSSGTVFAVRDTGDSASTFTIDDTGLASASNVSILNAGKLSMYESGSGNYSSLAAGTQSADIRYTLPTTQPSTNQVLKAASVSGSGPYDVTTSWSTPSGGVDWTDVTGTSQTAAAGNGYLANNASLVTFTLPTPAVGSIVEIVGVGAGGWLANCASGHTVRMGNVVSASTGSVASTNRYDSIKLLGVSATAWQIIHAVGTVDIV